MGFLPEHLKSKAIPAELGELQDRLRGVTRSSGVAVLHLRCPLNSTGGPGGGGCHESVVQGLVRAGGREHRGVKSSSEEAEESPEAQGACQSVQEQMQGALGHL